MATLREKAKAAGATEIPAEDIIIPNTDTEANKIDTAFDFLDIAALKTIDRFRNAFRGQTDPERKQLLDSINEYGIATPIKVWVKAIDNNDYEHIIIDGHNRYEIALKLGHKSVPVQFAEFVSEDDAYLFIVNEQLGRRNLTPDEHRDLLSIKKQLLQQKPSFHGNQHIKAERQNDAPPKGKASEQVAAENGVSPSQVERADKKRRDAITTLKNTGLPLKEEIEGEILKGQIKASKKNMEILATLDKGIASDLFAKMAETKVLTIPEEAKNPKKEAAMTTHTEAIPDGPEKEPGCIYIDEGCEITGEPDAVLVKLCDYSMIVSFIKKNNAKYPFKGIAVVGGDDNTVKETYFLFGNIAPTNRIFKGQEELKSTYNFSKSEKGLIWHAKPGMTDDAFVEYCKGKRKLTKAESIRSIIIASNSEGFKNDYQYLTEDFKAEGRLAKTPQQQSAWIKKFQVLQDQAFGIGEPHIMANIKKRLVQ
jgi:ParB-like chromosome segregation protein Spo0J